MHNANVIVVRFSAQAYTLSPLESQPAGRYNAMQRTYDIFERFSDDSSLWRTTVDGQFDSERWRRSNPNDPPTAAP